MTKSERKKCSQRIDPRTCQYGHVAGTTVYCPYKDDQAVWKRHPERHSDYPMEPGRGECEYPELYGKDLKKPKTPYTSKLPVVAGAYTASNWLDIDKAEKAVTITH